MKTSSMRVLYELDKQVDSLVKQKQKQYSCFITLYHDAKTDSIWMNVFTFDLRTWDDILVSDKDNKDSTCVGIMRWFKAHGEEVKSN